MTRMTTRILATPGMPDYGARIDSRPAAASRTIGVALDDRPPFALPFVHILSVCVHLKEIAVDGSAHGPSAEVRARGRVPIGIADRIPVTPRAAAARRDLRGLHGWLES